MSSINTGMQRAIQLTVTKMSGETVVTGYPRIYRLTDAFGNYTAVSESDLSVVKITEYKQRLSAFKEYVESVEIGISIDTSGAYIKNLTSCPI